MPSTPIHSPLEDGDRRLVRGMALMFVSGLAGSAANGAIHHIAVDLHPFIVTFFRNLIGLLVLLPLLLRVGLIGLRPRRPGLQILRGLLQVVSAMLFVTALALTPLAKATALNFTAPLFAAILAVIILREAIQIRRIAALSVGFTGMLVVLQPWEGGFDLGSILMLLSALLWAVGMILIKIMMRTESSLTTTILTAVTSTPFAFIAALTVWQTPTGEQFIWLIGTGVVYSLAQLAFAQALKEIDLTALLPLDFLKLIWAAAIGYLFFSEAPGVATWMGGAMIMGAATYIAYRERKAHKAESKSII